MALAWPNDSVLVLHTLLLSSNRMTISWRHAYIRTKGSWKWCRGQSELQV